MVDRSCIMDDPQKTICMFVADGVAEIPFHTIGADVDWAVDLPSTSDSVCSHFPNHYFPMYEVVFKDVGFVFYFLLSNGRFFGGRSFLLLKCIPTLMRLCRRSSWCVNTWKSTPPKMYSSPFLLFSEGRRREVVLVGCPSARRGNFWHL